MPALYKDLNTVCIETGKKSKFNLNFPVVGTENGIINICQYGTFLVEETKMCALPSSTGVLNYIPCIDFTNKSDALEALKRIAEVIHKCGK
jgi:hypothetical protein